MNTGTYDSYKLIIQEKPNFNLIILVEYYKKGKLVDKKRTANQSFIRKIINQATVDMKKIKYNGDNLEIIGDFDGKIIIENYTETRKRKDFWELNKKVRRKLSKKDLNQLTGVKNLKVTRDSNKIKKSKLKKKQFLRTTTLAFIIMSQIALINKILPEYNLPSNKTIELSIENEDEYEESVNVEDVVSTIEKNYSILNTKDYEVHKLIKDELTETKSKEKVEDNHIDFNEQINNQSEILFEETKQAYQSVVPTYQANSYNDVLTEVEFNKLVAMVQAEAGGQTPQDHYTDAMAVTSTVLNRLEDEKWRKDCGDTIMEQIHASDQFLGTKTSTYRQVVNNPEKASPEVVQAVKDCLSGTRNNPYLSFRAKGNKAPGRTQFVDGGNNYFGLPEPIQNQINEDNVIGTK